jgi:hypothetical protein
MQVFFFYKNVKNISNYNIKKTGSVFAFGNGNAKNKDIYGRILLGDNPGGGSECAESDQISNVLQF